MKTITLVLMWTVLLPTLALKCSDFVRSSDSYSCQSEAELENDVDNNWIMFSVKSKINAKNMILRVRRVYDADIAIQTQTHSKLMDEIESPFLLKIISKTKIGQFHIETYEEHGLKLLNKIVENLQLELQIHQFALKIGIALTQFLMTLHQNRWIMVDFKIDDVVAGLMPKDPVYVITFDGAAELNKKIKFGSNFVHWDPKKWTMKDSEPFLAQPSIDVYCLGLILYQIVHKGKLPFPGKTLAEVKTEVLAGAYQINKGVNQELSYIITRMLLADPAKRPPLDCVLTMLKKIQGFEKVDLFNKAVSVNNKIIHDKDLENLIDQDFLVDFTVQIKDYHKRLEIEEERLRSIGFLDRLIPTKSGRMVFYALFYGFIFFMFGIALFFGCQKWGPNRREPGETPGQFRMPIKSDSAGMP